MDKMHRFRVMVLVVILLALESGSEDRQMMSYASMNIHQIRKNIS